MRKKIFKTSAWACASVYKIEKHGYLPKIQSFRIDCIIIYFLTIGVDDKDTVSHKYLLNFYILNV